MSKEKMKILEMIEKKIITPAEGLELLTACDSEVKVETKVNIEKEKVDVHDEICDDVEDCCDDVEDCCDDVEDCCDDIDFKVKDIKRKAKELKDKILEDIDVKEFKVKGDIFGKEFQKEMASLGENLKKEMKFFQKDAKILSKEMSKFGKETADLTKGIVSDVLESVQAMDDVDLKKKMKSDEYVMSEDSDVRKYNITQEFSLDCDGKKDITISVISTDVNIVTEEREDVLVKYINYSENDKSQLKVVVEEDSKGIKISEKKDKENAGLFGFFGSGGKELLIRLPRKYKESLGVKSVSGDLDLNYLDSDSFRFSSVSGDLTADIIYSVNSLIKTTSGDCDIELFRGNMICSSVSGDINMKYEKLDGDLTAKSISGDVNIQLPKTSEFEINSKTVSGDLDCDFPLVIIGSSKRGRLRGKVGSDDYSITTSTTSGDLEINRY